ncbi:FliG C-terminal domain-containing protein [Maridesulfovibrio sp.]|uniref:FliG C-terminal domain-containing protein n=1 Tax=Maridesulfovibrio sp. TaxID=2795000 RepID=UPI002A18E346|nr:FliG C-terminal domain-containing protein [Maridesulfovibrio sp.]
MPVSGQPRDTGTDISTPFGWFVFRLCLNEIKSDHPDILKNISAIAELAAVIPPDRWEMIESGFPLSDRDRLQAFQLGIESIKPACIKSHGKHVLNLIRNLQPDFDALPDSYADYRDIFQQLTDLKYWDALLLEQEDFSRIIARLSPQEVAGLSSSSWGSFAVNMGMPLDKYEKYDCSWDQARSSLLAALADTALQSADFRIPASAGHAENDSVIELLDRLVKKYADGFVEGTLHVTTDDLLLSEQILAGLSLMEEGAGVAAFNCFHDNIIFDLLYGLEPYTDNFEMICGLLPQLDQEKRNALRQKISRSDCKKAATFAKALSFGFEQMTELSDVQLRELLKYVSNEDLCLALINGSTDLIEKFMSNMSERAGNMIREDMEIGRHSFSREHVLKARQRLVNLVLEYGLLPADGGVQRESNKSIVRRIISNLYQSEGEDDLF